MSDWHWRTVVLPALRSRACHECQRCGMPERPMGWYRLLEGAHLDGDHNNESDDNLALLCRRCHRAHDYRVWSLQHTTWIERERRREQAEKELLALQLDAKRPVLQLTEAAVAAPPYKRERVRSESLFGEAS